MSVLSWVAFGHEGNYVIIGVIWVYCSSSMSLFPPCSLSRLGQNLSYVELWPGMW